MDCLSEVLALPRSATTSVVARPRPFPTRRLAGAGLARQPLCAAGGSYPFSVSRAGSPVTRFVVDPLDPTGQLNPAVE